jgi:hypothetical protein
MNKNQKSRRSRGFAWMCKSGLLLGAAALLTTSCATDGYDDDERFDNGVSGQALTSPSAESITITPSADGKTMTITWPVVMGAGGYLFSFYDVTNLDAPIVKDSLVDGCSVTVNREEDMNYRVDLKTMGSAKSSTSDASESTQMLFSTFADAYATIPAGSELSKYFTDNPVPESDEAVYYDLEPGAQYTLDDILDFSNHKVVLRTTSKTSYATITYGQSGSIEYCGGLSLKYLNFDCAATSKPVLAFSATPAEGILDADNNNHNQITDPTTIQNCNFTGVKGMMLFDNKVKYCLKTFYMENCLVHLESVGMSNNSIFYVYDGGGFINDFTISNSTIWNTGESDFMYLIRYNNSGRRDRAGYTSNSINIMNSTMYNLGVSGQMCNHGGYDGRATSNYIVTNNIFVNCGSAQVPRRIVGRRGGGDIKFANYTYCNYEDGVAKFELEGAPDYVEGAKSEYDDSKSALQCDPAFVDPANGNFTPQGAEQLSLRTGDPRWLP